jgi:hypothetical protein
MKTCLRALTRSPGFLVTAFLFLAVSASAAETFPGLKTILTDAEWKRAGLDRLTPDELGVIDAALIRREVGATARHQAEITATQQQAIAATAAEKASPVGGFGLSADKVGDWRSAPSLKAKVVKWETPNRFRLDNGQVWESSEPIIYELVGKEIEIQPRPNGAFALVVGDINTTIRISRVR